MIADFWQVAGLFLHEAVDGVGVDVLIFGQIQRLEEVVHAGGAGDEPAAVRLLAEVLGDLIVLIPDLAHQLFEDIFQRDDALGAAVLIHDDGHMVMLLPQGAQELRDLGGAGGIQGRSHEIVDLRRLFQAGNVKVLFMDHADDIVDGAMVDRQTGVARLREGLGQLLKGDVVLHGHHIHTGGQDLLHLHVIELDGGADQLALPVGQLAVIFGLADHGHQLTLGDGVALAAVNKMVQQPFPLAEQPCQRGKHQHQQAEHRRNCGGYRFRHLLGKALGCHLAKDQHHDGQHHSGHRSAPLCTQHFGENDGADGSGGDVHDIVADEDGGEQLIILFRHRQHAGGCAVAVVGAALEADLIQGGKSGLGCGEKGGEGHQNHQCHPKRHTAIVHNKGKSHS